MPTKAGRLRIEDIRVGRVIYDLGIDWETFSAFARPLKIVAKAPHGYNGGRDIMFTTLEPEGNYHSFHSRRNITQCGFYGTFDQDRPDSEILERNAQPINFFVNKRAAERYMDRMRADGTYPWERPAAFEAYGYKPAKPVREPKNLGPAAQREVAAIWGKIRAEHPDSPLTGISNKLLVAAVSEYVQKVLRENTVLPEIKVTNCEQLPDGSISYTISGPPEVIAKMRALQEGQPAYSIGISEGEVVEPDRDYVKIWSTDDKHPEPFSALDSLRSQLIGTRHEYDGVTMKPEYVFNDHVLRTKPDPDGITPPPEGEGKPTAGE